MVSVIIGLTVLAILLLALEVLLPGAILGVLGVISLVAALALVFTAEQLDPIGASGRTLVAAGIIVVTGASIGLWLKNFHKTAIGRQFVLREHVKGSPDLEGGDGLLLGKSGTAATDMRPAGKIFVDKRRIDAVAENGFIVKGQSVEVVKVEGMRTVVRKARS